MLVEKGPEKIAQFLYCLNQASIQLAAVLLEANRNPDMVELETYMESHSKS